MMYTHNTEYHQERLLHTYEAFINPLSKEQQKVKREKGEFEFIPLNNDHFCKQLNDACTLLRVLGKTGNIHFVDVGCGYGSKLVLAHSILTDTFGWPNRSKTKFKVSGIEVCKEYVDIANKMIHGICNYNDEPDDSVRIIHADARNVDYRDFSIIYYYCPMLDGKLQRQLEERIAHTAKKGTLIIANLDKHTDAEWKKLGVVYTEFDRVMRKK